MYRSMEIGGLEVEVPLLSGGGVVKTIEDVRRMSMTGVGAIEAGTFCLEPRVGNSPDGQRVFHHDEETGLTTNALGMPGQGVAKLAEELPEMLAISRKERKPLIPNIAPVSHNPAQEVYTILSTLDANPKLHSIPAIMLNASCPNVPAGDNSRHELLSHHPEQMLDVLRVIDEFRFRTILFSDLWVRISPFRDKADVAPLVRVCEEAGVDVISAFNTFPVGHEGQTVLQVPKGIGGLSGRAMERTALEQTGWLMEEINSQDSSIEVVGANAIYDGASMKRRMDLGVKAVSATTIFYLAEDWAAAADKVIYDFATLAEADPNYRLED